MRRSIVLLLWRSLPKQICDLLAESIVPFRPVAATTELNCSTPLANFLPGRPGFGVCGFESISENGHPVLSHCRIALMRQYRQYLEVRPRYFFFFSTHFPDFPIAGRDSLYWTGARVWWNGVLRASARTT